MSSPHTLAQAVEAAIVASAHLTAYEQVAAAADACQRLGRLTSGRWRSVARDLGGLGEELQTAFDHAAEAVTAQATNLGVPSEALWTAGDAAATLDLLRDDALDEVEEGSAAARVLQSRAVYGVSFVEDAEVPDRGTTLLFGWAEPLAPATWPWQASWAARDAQDDGEQDDGDADELDVWEAGELAEEESLLAELARELGDEPAAASAALREAALALTRASLLAGAGHEQDEEEDDDDAADAEGANGSRA